MSPSAVVPLLVNKLYLKGMTAVQSLSVQRWLLCPGGVTRVEGNVGGVNGVWGCQWVGEGGRVGGLEVEWSEGETTARPRLCGRGWGEWVYGWGTLVRTSKQLS